MLIITKQAKNFLAPSARSFFPN